MQVRETSGPETQNLWGRGQPLTRIGWGQPLLGTCWPLPRTCRPKSTYSQICPDIGLPKVSEQVQTKMENDEISRRYGQKGNKMAPKGPMLRDGKCLENAR